MNKNVFIASLFVQLAVAYVQQVFGVSIAMDSLQHEACNETYEIDTFCDH